MDGYLYNSEIVELHDGAHQLGRLQMYCRKDNNPDYRFNFLPYPEKEFTNKMAKTIAKEIGLKLLEDGIMKVITGPDFVSVVMDNIVMPNK